VVVAAAPARGIDGHPPPGAAAATLRPVAPEQAVRLDPLLRDDRRARRQLAAQHRRRDDLGECVDLPGAVAAEKRAGEAGSEPGRRP
jgi:hypothetical protein